MSVLPVVFHSASSELCGHDGARNVPPQVVSSPADVMVTIWNEDSIAEAVSLAHDLRAAGIALTCILRLTNLGNN